MTRIVVVGGTGLIGAKTVARLAARGHEVTAAASRSGVNTLTGEGLSAALEGAEVVVDTTRPPSTSTGVEVFAFFTRSTANLLAAGVAAGVRHHVAHTIVGTDADVSVPYYTAKRAQEELVRDGGIPFSLVHATQFFEFVAGIAAVSTVGDEVRLPGVLVQPIAGDDVAVAMAAAAEGPPVGDIEVGGPELFRLDDFVRRGLSARGDARQVLRDDAAPYFGGTVSETALVPGEGARLYATRFDDWLAHPGARPGA
jgi:uncharacterized protein YbjT (DUF2867 family)